MKRYEGFAFVRGRPGRYLFAACAFTVATCVALGLLLAPRSMAVNLLAGVASIALGVPVAIWIVDRYIRYLGRSRWSRVEELTHRAIAAHLCDATVEALIGTSALRDHRPMALILGGRNRPDARAPEGMATVAGMLRDAPNPSDNDVSDDVVRFYEENRWDLDELCDRLFSRVVEYSGEQDLIDALAALDVARRALHNSVVAQKTIAVGGIVSNLADFVDASADVYRTLLSHWKAEA